MKTVLLIILILFTAQTTRAQVLDSISELRPLSEILELAETNSQKNQAMSIQQMRIQEEISGLRKNWMDHIFFTGNMTYGNGVVLDEINTGTGNGFNYTNRKNTFYNVGVNLYLPLSKITNRKHQIKEKELQITEIEHLKRMNEESIHSEIIRHYSSLKYYLKELQMHAEILRTNEAQMKISENSFKKGIIDMKAFRGSVDAYYTSRMQFEKARREADYAAQMLKEISGTSIFKL